MRHSASIERVQRSGRLLAFAITGAKLAVRVGVLVGFAAVAWVVSAFVANAAAHADTTGTSPASAEVRDVSLATALQDARSTIVAPVQAHRDVSAARSAQSSGESSPLGLEQATFASPLTDSSIFTPLTDALRPLAEQADPVLLPVASTLAPRYGLFGDLVSSTPSVSPVDSVPAMAGQSASVVRTAELDTQRAHPSDVAVHENVPDGAPAVPMLPSQSPVQHPGDLGVVSGGLGSGISSHFGGVAMLTHEQAFPKLDGFAAVGTVVPAAATAEVLENPTFCPD